MRSLIYTCLMIFASGHGHAFADATLLDFSRVASVAQKHMKALQDGSALTFWMTGVTDDSARMISRSEMAGPCRMRVTTMLQDPPKWGQMTIYIYDFSRITGFTAFADMNDQARQSPAVALSDPRAQVGSLHGKSLVCASFHDLGSDPEPYAYCEDRVDVSWAEFVASKEEMIKSLSAVADSCNLPGLKKAL